MYELNTGIRAESPLHHLTKINKTSASKVQISEQAFWGHLVIRGSSSNADFVAGIHKATGLTLPLEPLTSSHHEQSSIHWQSPNEWLLLSEQGGELELENKLRDTLTGHFSIVDVSGGQTVLKLTGPDAEMVLRKSCGYDIKGNLPIGKTITTRLAKTSVVVHSMAPQTYLLIVRRSFADYVWRWLEEAAQEYL